MKTTRTGAAASQLAQAGAREFPKPDRAACVANQQPLFMQETGAAIQAASRTLHASGQT